MLIPGWSNDKYIWARKFKKRYFRDGRPLIYKLPVAKPIAGLIFVL
jgi:hypothetical protein